MIDWDTAILGPVMAVFGEAVSYVPRGGAPIAIPDAVFDEEASEVQIGEDGQATTLRKPMLGLRIARFTMPPAQSDRVTIVRTGVTYIVKDVQPDGHGHVRLELMVAAQ